MVEVKISRHPDKTVITLSKPTRQIIITTSVEVAAVSQDRLNRVYIRIAPGG